ncbi:MAG: hypothetical protein M3065_21820 [Actinomycetota bacterium]|nr:hypothetical protein [Actinomycetota bacterium]
MKTATDHGESSFEGGIPSNLTPEFAVLVEAIAERVVDILSARAATPSRAGLLTASELAEELSVARGFVYDHAEELGAVRLGAGSKPRLRFDLEHARSALACCGGERSQGAKPSKAGADAPARARRPRRLPSGLPKPGSVLEVRGSGRAAA